MCLHACKCTKLLRLHEVHVVTVAQLDLTQRADLQKHVEGELAYVICAGTYISVMRKQKHLLHVVVNGGNLAKYYLLFMYFWNNRETAAMLSHHCFSYGCSLAG